MTQEQTLLVKLKSYRTNWHLKLLTLEEELAIEKSRKDIVTKFGKTNRTHVIIGWVSKKHVNKLNEICERTSKGHVSVHYEDPKTNPEPEDIPIKYDNPKWAKPFEHLVKIYSPPRYNEMDPTMLIAIPFILFFGLMLGDAGYGLVILLFCIYGFFYIGKVRPYVKIASYIGIFMGISTIFFGFLMGTFFGDLVPRLIYNDTKEPLYRATILGFQLPYDPIRSPMLLLILSIIIGIVYLVMSLVVGAAQNIINKNYRSLVLDQISYFLLVPSALILILWAFFDFEFQLFILYIAGFGVVFGTILIFIEKNMLFFFEWTGFLGDTLSFTRLLALGMATAGIAMTINVITELMPPLLGCICGLAIGIILIKYWQQMELKFMLYIGYFLFILAIIGFIGIALNNETVEILVTIGVGAGLGAFLCFTHLINLVLQALGAGVHSLRLQYVEFFSRCYEGGGNMFRPFSSARQFTRLKSRR
jgi:V/A-type H+-transporting ATPase subunit I